MTQALARLYDLRPFRYLLASIAALGGDFSCYLMLLQVQVSPVPAAVVGYAVGLVVHWYLSSRAVFAANLARPGAARLRQQVLFVGSALAGLGITTAIVWSAGLAGVDPRLAKAMAVAVSFLFTWQLRSRAIFR